MKRYAYIFGVITLVVFSAGLGATTVYMSKFDDLKWHCSNWEDHWNVGLGHHPAIVLYAERPASATADRQVCFATLASDE